MRNPNRFRIPLNLFGVGFGFAGLATTWRAAANVAMAPSWASNTLLIIASLAWLATAILYLRYTLTSHGTFARDLRDMSTGPFASLALITPMLLATDGIAPLSRPVAAVLVDILLVLVVLLGGWFTGWWMHGGTDLDQLHPGYFLPTVAGGLLASTSASAIGQHRLAEALFGLGLVCWLILGSIMLGRLVFRPPLPDALIPTMAVEVAPAAIASIAYLAMNGGRIDLFAAALAGYGILMVAAQAPLLPRYLRLKFSLGTWAFTFSWTAVASAVLYWIAAEHASGRRLLTYLVLTAITGLVAGIAARTILAIARRSLLPPLAVRTQHMPWADQPLRTPWPERTAPSSVRTG